MAHLNECLLLNIKKTQQCHIWKLNPSFLFDLYEGMVTNQHQWCTSKLLKRPKCESENEIMEKEESWNTFSNL
jgi:hypothetical protein